MSFSHAAAAHVVPLLSRLAIAAVMIPLGWTDLTTTSTFTGEDAAWIARLEVAASSPSSAASTIAWIRQVTESPEGSPNTADTPATQASEPAESTPPVSSPEAPTEPVLPAAEATLPSSVMEVELVSSDEVVTARHLHRWSILFAEAGAPGSVPLAWTTALLEVIGGSLLVLGLVTRVWGVLYAALFASLIWILGIPYSAPNYLFGADVAAFESVAAGLGMLVLSLGLALTGGGFLSLDRAIFRPPSSTASPPIRTSPATTTPTPRPAGVSSASTAASGPLPIAGAAPTQAPSGTRTS